MINNLTFNLVSIKKLGKSFVENINALERNELEKTI